MFNKHTIRHIVHLIRVHIYNKIIVHIMERNIKLLEQLIDKVKIPL